jgi:hypothetical protein
MRHFRLTALVVGAFFLAACGGLQVVAFEDAVVNPPYIEPWDGRGFDFEKCRLLSGCQHERRSG